jgi:hypothetical protein
LESGLEQGLRASLKEMNTREPAYNEQVDDCFVATHEVIDHVNRSYIGQKEGSRLIYGYKTRVADLELDLEVIRNISTIEAKLSL